MKAILLGSHSDIAKAITSMMEADGWEVHGWARDDSLPQVRWDLVIVAIGKVAPVGLWHEQGHERWDETIRSNLLLPAKLLRRLWGMRNPQAKVCWLAGSNPNTIMDGYSAYNVGKMAVLKLIEQLDHEYPDVTLFALGPGVCSTKIHSATILQNWPNPRLTRALKDGSFTKMEDVYKALKWCIAQEKAVVGGRNICVSDMDYRHGNLVVNLTNDESMFKLRRNEGRKTI